MDFKNEILKMPTDKKILLANDIWDSISNKQELELSDDIKAELDNRIERHESGEAKYYTLEEIRERISKRRREL